MELARPGLRDSAAALPPGGARAPHRSRGTPGPYVCAACWPRPAASLAAAWQRGPARGRAPPALSDMPPHRCRSTELLKGGRGGHGARRASPPSHLFHKQLLVRLQLETDDHGPRTPLAPQRAQHLGHLQAAGNKALHKAWCPACGVWPCSRSTPSCAPLTFASVSVSGPSDDWILCSACTDADSHPRDGRPCERPGVPAAIRCLPTPAVPARTMSGQGMKKSETAAAR